MLGQLLHDMDALSVLALGVDNLYGLVFAHDDAAVAHLSTHLAIEGGGVEHQFIEGVLLLGHLAVTQDMAVVFVVIITHELLFAGLQFRPVAVLHGGGVARTVFLLLHLHLELCFVDCQAVLPADELGQVEGESVSVEQTEGSGAVKHLLAFALHLVYGGA